MDSFNHHQDVGDQKGLDGSEDVNKINNNTSTVSFNNSTNPAQRPGDPCISSNGRANTCDLTHFEEHENASNSHCNLPERFNYPKYNDNESPNGHDCSSNSQTLNNNQHNPSHAHAKPSKTANNAPTSSKEPTEDLVDKVSTETFLNFLSTAYKLNNLLDNGGNADLPNAAPGGFDLSQLSQQNVGITDQFSLKLKLTQILNEGE